jgi:hypothetical protein
MDIHYKTDLANLMISHWLSDENLDGSNVYIASFVIDSELHSGCVLLRRTAQVGSMQILLPKFTYDGSELHNHRNCDANSNRRIRLPGITSCVLQSCLHTILDHHAKLSALFLVP